MRTNRKKAASKIDTAIVDLRNMALEAESGALLGDEGTLVAKLRISRATLRQAARLLEREGLLRVRRGIHGGYFAARPIYNSLEYAVGAHLESLDVTPGETTMVASVLWIGLVGIAAGLKTEEAKALAQHFRGKVDALRPDAAWDDVLDVEQGCRKAFFDLLKFRYVEHIFNTNIAFAYRKGFLHPGDRDDGSGHREFVRGWREAKLLELEGIAHGDPELAMMAARYMRKLWDQRVWGRD